MKKKQVEFEEIKDTVYVSRKPRYEETDPCGCADSSEGRICYDISCVNFSTHVECVDCSSRRCANMRFQKRKWAPTEVKKVCSVIACM